MAVARYVAAYGADALQGAWPTKDGVVPWRVFTMLFEALPAVEAATQLAATRAVSLGIEAALGGTGAKGELQRLEDRAMGVMDGAEG